MTMQEKIRTLQQAEFLVGKRDPLVNPAFAGAYMVSEQHHFNFRGGWAIVGDDLDLLVEEAFEFFELGRAA